VGLVTDHGLAAAVAASEKALGGIALRADRHAYATSHELFDVDVALPDGSVFLSVAKETSRRLPTRPGFVQSPGREGEVYTRLLEPAGVWAPRLVAVTDAHLVLERVEGRPLWQLEPAEIAPRVGAVLRAVHDALARDSDAPFLVRYDRRHYDRWFRRACVMRPRLAELQPAFNRAVDRLLSEPQIVVHGELYPSNVLVNGDDVLIVDWESAATAPPVVDLAAVTTGWTPGATAAVLAAYGAVEPLALACARLYLAIRWLGWSSAWTAPEEHARDWQREAYSSAEDVVEARAA
jgi:aminoglycoside phosphotransferase (APT) family kinase protein